MTDPLDSDQPRRRADDRIVLLEHDVRELRDIVMRHFQDERDLGAQVAVLTESVRQIQSSSTEQKSALAGLQSSINELTGLLNRARGGWLVLSAIGTIIGMALIGAGSLISWSTENWERLRTALGK
ncbi:MAG TPA: hypothetical protein PKC15_07915 [Rhodocyclaceae bacterium]|uniref:hypothetical protein n=1 Tax=Plasticicumulans sp. TaxID=2307179 RepID=UPI002CC0D4E4|nr:hypothetical protein [Rhodocyclaceae bacterium]